MTHELAKRFRPKSLASVVGNASTVQALTGMLAAGKLPHTLLLYGPSGCGKTTLARIVRKELGCSNLDFAEQNCAADFRGVDSVRDIQRAMKLSPTGGKVRVWLLDEVHQMTKDAQHAALKMLEDTPRHVYFILCTTDPGKLLPTIRSRCTKLPVKLLTSAEMKKLLHRVMKKAKIKLDEDTVLDVIEAAEGSARNALVLLEKLSHLDGGNHVAAIKEKLEVEQEAIMLARALLKRESWDKVAAILKELKEDAEGVRHMLLAYVTTVLLGSRKNDQAYKILDAMAQPFWDTRRAGLVKACYEVVFGS